MDNYYYAFGNKLYDVKRFEEAVAFFQAHQDDPKCAYGLARSYHKGDGVEQDCDKAQRIVDGAIDALKALAEGGDKEADDMLSWCIDMEYAPYTPELEAIFAEYKACGQPCYDRVPVADLREWAREVEERKAENKLYRKLAYGEDYMTEKEELEEVQSKAAAGDTAAMVTLGNCYKDGKGVEKNMYVAVDWYRRAAVEDNIDAMLALAEWYLNCVVKDRQVGYAIIWLEKAYRLGSARAAWILSIIYYSRDILGGTNITLGRERLHYAAEHGDCMAQYDLSQCYFGGDHEDADPELAYYWLEQSYINGCTTGIPELARAYYHGTYFAEDKDKAFELVTELFTHDQDKANSLLAELFGKPNGGDEDV